METIKRVGSEYDEAGLSMHCAKIRRTRAGAAVDEASEEMQRTGQEKIKADAALAALEVELRRARRRAPSYSALNSR